MGTPDTSAAEIEIATGEGYTAARFLGTFSVAGFQRRAEAASKACRDGKTGRLFVDVTAFDVSPSIGERYDIASHAVKVSAGLKVAVLITPTFLDPNKFGIMVAQNRGLKVEAFTERQKALDWLLAPASGA